MELKEKVAVITGAASGIGLATTKRFLAEGMSVVMVDIEEPVLMREANDLITAGEKVTAIVCDVADASAVFKMRDEVLAKYGTVHVIFANAGVASGKPIKAERPTGWDWVIGVNVLGVGYTISAFIQNLIDQNEGHVVVTASEAGLTSSPMLGSYHVSKYAMVGLSESLSMELEGTNVNVTCLCPEFVDTQIFNSTRNAPAVAEMPPPAGTDMKDIAKMLNSYAMNPADVAGRIVYAINANQFWILTHQSTQRKMMGRNRYLENFTTPKLQG